MIENLKIALKKSPDLNKSDETKFDEDRAYLTKPDLFPRFTIDEYIPVDVIDLQDEEYVIVVDIRGQKIGLLAKQMSYHHVAQGNYEGNPFMVAFCIVCHSAMALTPVIDGTVHNFSVGGLYDGLALLIDDETETYWEHITGKAVKGPLEGRYIPTFSVNISTLEEIRRTDQNVLMAVSKQSLFGKLSSKLLSRNSLYNQKGSFPPGFKKTMKQLDRRLEPFTAGLGIIIQNEEPRKARFYPKIDLQEGDILDIINERPVRITLHPISKSPVAYYIDVNQQQNSEKPHQIFTRWYGFSFNYPDVKIIRSTRIQVQGINKLEMAAVPLLR